MGKRKKIKVKGEFTFFLMVYLMCILPFQVGVALLFLKPEIGSIALYISFAIIVLSIIILLTYNHVILYIIKRKFIKNIDNANLVEAKVVGYRFFEDYRKISVRPNRKIWVKVEIDNKIYKMIGRQSVVTKTTSFKIDDIIQVYMSPKSKYVMRSSEYKKLKKDINAKKSKKEKAN